MTELPAISRQIWDMKYRLKQLDGTPIDTNIDATWMRVAAALAKAEPEDRRADWQRRFYSIMADGLFSPAGRIIAGAGSDRNVTLSNCLSADTLILTGEYGIVPIGSIAGEVVSVLDGNGDWVSAPINSFGERATAPVELVGGYNGRIRKTIYATSDHRWILADGSERVTADLHRGLRLKTVKRTACSRDLNYAAGVRHGVVYGDGSQRPEGEAKLRLCGGKAALLPFFQDSDWTVSYPESSEGDPCLYLGRGKTTYDLKSFPLAGHSLQYVTGFLHGWMATDGCINRGKAVLSCTSDGVEFLKKFGPVSGMEVSSIVKLHDETNYGQRGRAIYNVHFHRWTMTESDFLLPKHAEAFGEADYGWVVDRVGDYGDPEPVFCPRVTTTDSVQLDLGIHTGQCYTMGTIPDSMDGIFSHLKEAALTMQAGGGIGYDFSTLRPKGAPVHGVGADASGPLTFMDVWDAMCRTVMSAGSRRGAMMATMRCDHPDIEDFIEAKRDPKRLRMFNVSVLVTDEFMGAVEAGHNWRLHFENRRGETISEKIVDARSLWDKIMESTYAYAEPGVIFIDRVNRDHNLGYLETVATTNPCGEKPMGPYASCLLGSMNLAKFVKEPFTAKARFDFDGFKSAVATAIRMMDNVVDVGKFPLEAQRKKAQQDRQLGLGVTGLADALIMLGMTYGAVDAEAFTENVMFVMCCKAYQTSVDLAKEKGPFPTFDANEFLKIPRFASRLPAGLQQQIRRFGIRNGLLVSIAPTGTISLFAGNVSSGIEPVFANSYTRKVLQPDGTKTEERVEDFAVAAYRAKWEQDNATNPLAFDESDLPPQFVTAQTLKPEDHVRMQAAAQKWVDSSISKTVNVPEDISFDDFKAVYKLAYDLGCKGCTTYRPNAITGSVLSVEPKKEPEPKMVDLLVSTDSTAAKVALEQATTSLMKAESSGPKVAEFKTTRLWDGSTLSTNAGAAVEDLRAIYEPPGGAPFSIQTGTRMAAPVERPAHLYGSTYKVKWPGSPHALYITINDVDEDQHRRPFEIFLNSKNTEHYAWTVALTRMVSAIFRRGGDIDFVAEELKAVFDPRGGAWVEGKYVPSILAAIGDVIAQHLKTLRFGDLMAGVPFTTQESPAEVPAKTVASAGKPCPSCGGFNFVSEGGCMNCKDCGHSACG